MKTIKNIIMGFIIGDSYGLSILNNETDFSTIKLVNNKVLNIEKGSFSYLTTNMLLTMDSISKKKYVDPKDIINKMCTSLIVGKYTNNGKFYKLDKETLNILEHYSKKNNLNYKYNEYDLSAYSISRVVPIVIYNYYNIDTLDTLIPVISLTNNNQVVLLGVYIYYKYLLNLMNGYDKYKSLKIDIPKYFDKNSKKIFKNILKGNIYYNEIIFDDNIINVLKIVFYVILNSNNINDMFMMISNLSGCTNIYSSLIITVGCLIYNIDDIPKNIVDAIKNKKNINKYIKDFEGVFYEKIC